MTLQIWYLHKDPATLFDVAAVRAVNRDTFAVRHLGDKKDILHHDVVVVQAYND